MSVDATLADHVIHAIYSAAGAPEKWPDALQLVAESFDGAGAVLVFARSEQPFAVVTSPSLAAAGRAFHEGWLDRDLRGDRTWRLFREGQEVVTDRHVCSPDEIASATFYTDFLVPRGMGWFMATEVSPEPDVLVAVSIQRAKSIGPFTDDELKRFPTFGQHIEQALRLTVQLMRSEVVNLALGDALNRLSCGVVLLDAKGRVCFSNGCAVEMLGSGLVLPEGQLRLTGANTGSFGGMVPERPGGPIVLSGTTPDRPYVAYLLPMPGRNASAAEDIFGTATTMVLVFDTAGTAGADPTVVRDVFGLTLGEARIATQIGLGMGPGAAAQALGISEATARTVLKRIFSKVGVSRQSELTALLARLARLGPELR